MAREFSPSERREVSEGLHTHGLAGGQLHDGGVTGLDELGVVLNRLTGTTINLLLDLSKLNKENSGNETKIHKTSRKCEEYSQVYYR